MASGEPAPAGSRWRSALRRRPRHVGEEVWRFLLVGGAGFVVDVGVFTLLRTSALGLLEDRPLTAKVVSTVVATAVTWLGNRWWTWGHRTTGSTRRELLLFLAVNAGGTGIALACLAVSHYVLGLTSVLADNVSANGVGLVLGTAFRFVAYRALVFRDVPGRRPPPVPPSEALLVPGPHRTDLHRTELHRPGPGRSGAEPGGAA
ncbi:GtrA family protein [Pseudokineococcus marinus]|uniref:GtrA family protein n=1 Tax=Pseudokineococcus marinus TaxID=351215 RepID=UPI001BB2E861|nr:GtrA family protein [Pseudokineococcus marinus]